MVGSDEVLSGGEGLDGGADERSPAGKKES
jgi:hypothetical protein